MQATVGRWGNSLAVRLPAEVVQAIQLRDGERVEIATKDGDLILHRTEPRSVLTELFKGKTPEQWRSVYAGAYEWGPDVGSEVVE